MVKMLDRLQRMFLVIYAIGKDIFPFQSCNKDDPISLTRKVILILFSLMILALTFIAVLPFALFRTCLAIVLKIIHGKLYGGLLSGLDAIFEINPNKTVINVILIYSPNTNEFSIALDKMKQCVYHIHNSSFKFGSTIRKAFGYCYYLKQQVAFEDVVDVIKYNNDEYMDRIMLFDYLEKNCLTLEKNQMWRVVFFSQPIKWSQHNLQRHKQYAMVWTLRHSLGDGPSVISIFKRYIEEDVTNEKFDINKINSNKVHLNLNNVIVQRNPVTTELDGTLLQIEGNSNWYITSFIETEAKYIPLIKKIKDKMNVKFSEVLAAAISSSVASYISQRRIKLKNFTIGTVIRLKSEDLINLANGTYNFENITNNFGLVGLNLPLNVEERSLESTILYIHRYNKALRYAVDPLVAYEFLRNVCAFLPAKLTGSSCKLFMDSMTIGITNLLGFQNCTWCDNSIEDAFFFSPDFLNTGFIFNVFSYSGRLQILLTSRKGFVHHREELQKILDNVFENIHRAENEILRKEDCNIYMNL